MSSKVYDARNHINNAHFKVEIISTPIKSKSSKKTGRNIFDLASAILMHFKKEISIAQVFLADSELPSGGTLEDLW